VAIPEAREPALAPPPRRTRADAESRARPARTGRVEVRVHPWAEVFFNGKSHGTTPLPPLTVPAGRQIFVLRNSDLGVEKHVPIVVPAGGETTLTANLMNEPRVNGPAAHR